MPGWFWTSAGMRMLLASLVSGGYLLFQGTTAIGNTTITAVTPDPTGLATGAHIYGNGLVSSTTVVSTTSNSITVSNAASSAGTTTLIVQDSAAVGLSALNLHLVTTAPAATPLLAWSNLTEATYDGYAAVMDLAFGPPWSDAAGNNFVAGACQTFIPTDYTVPNTILGAALTWDDGGMGGPKLAAVNYFVNPIPLINPGDGFQYTPIVALPCDLTALPGSTIVV